MNGQHERATESTPVEISVICPVTRFAGDLADVHREFREVVAATGRGAEFLLSFPKRPAREGDPR